jgi:hypothetical protein
LKIHLPYHESDHLLNMAYNVLTGGTRLEDVERLRHDVAYMNALGADLIPDPTTAGDFCRRFAAEDAASLMDAVNAVRPALWRCRGRDLLAPGAADVLARRHDAVGAVALAGLVVEYPDVLVVEREVDYITTYTDNTAAKIVALAGDRLRPGKHHRPAQVRHQRPTRSAV